MLRLSFTSIFFLFVISILNAQTTKVYKSLEEALKEPEKVFYLDLSKEDNLNASLLECSNLKELHLDHMGLKTLPNFLSKLDKLEVLNLSGNEFEEFPPIILKLKQLKKLYLFDCNLNRIPDELKQLTALTHLNLGQNKLEDDFPLSRYHDQLVLPKSLSVLELRYCELDLLQPLIMELNHLDSLDLSFNQLKDIPVTINQLSKLSYLNLAFNQIKFIPSNLEQLGSLKVLDLRYNQLAYRPENLMEKKNLALNIHGNPFTKERAEKQELRRTTLKEVKDQRDGQIYPAMQFGQAYWMIKDLNWAIDSAISVAKERLCLYRSTEQAELRLCPAGWHQATLEDWRALNKLALAEFPIDPDEASNQISLEYGRWMYSTREDPMLSFEPFHLEDFYGAKYFMSPKWGKPRGFNNFFELSLFSKGMYLADRSAFLDHQPTPYFILREGGELSILGLFQSFKLATIKEFRKRKRPNIPDFHTTVRCVSDSNYTKIDYSSTIKVKEYIFPEIKDELKREFFDSSLNAVIHSNLKKEGSDYWIELILDDDILRRGRYTLEEDKYYLSAAIFYKQYNSEEQFAAECSDALYAEQAALPLVVEKGQDYKQMMQFIENTDSILFSTRFYLDERGYLVEERRSFSLKRSSSYTRERFYYKKGVGLVDIEYTKREVDEFLDKIKGK